MDTSICMQHCGPAEIKLPRVIAVYSLMWVINHKVKAKISAIWFHSVRLQKKSSKSRLDGGTGDVL